MDIKTVVVLDEDDHVYGIYDYLGWLKFRIEYLEQKLKGEAPTLYVINRWGGKNVLGKYANALEDPFPEATDGLAKIVDLQMQLRDD